MFSYVSSFFSFYPTNQLFFHCCCTPVASLICLANPCLLTPPPNFPPPPKVVQCPLIQIIEVYRSPPLRPHHHRPFMKRKLLEMLLLHYMPLPRQESRRAVKLVLQVVVEAAVAVVIASPRHCSPDRHFSALAEALQALELLLRPLEEAVALEAASSAAVRQLNRTAAIQGSASTAP